MADISDPFSRGTALTRVTGKMAEGFSKYSLMNVWNDTMKNFAAVTTQNRILSQIENAANGKLSAKERTYFAYLGFNDDMIKRIASEYKTHGKQSGYAHIGGVANWTDNQAFRAFNAALRKEAEELKKKDF
jgi:hypothetical protein